MKVRQLTHILILLVSLVISSTVHAVVPPPDGGYPGFTTAEGTNALKNLTTGVANTGIGWYSLSATDVGSYNTAVGAGALDLNMADNNTAVGVAALLLNTTGINNTALGTAALEFNDSGEGNTATGAFALFSNTEGQFNTANGEFALYFNTTGERNTAIGDSALYQNTEGDRNTAVGNTVLLNNTIGSDNTAIGFNALFFNNAPGNTAVGSGALASNTSGQANTAVGLDALRSNVNGGFNTATGYQTMVDNVAGGHNTAYGYNTLRMNTSGGDNTAIGETALFHNTTGGQNVALGEAAGLNQTTGSGNVYIGLGMVGVEGESNACYIASIFGQTSASGMPVLVNSNNKLGTAPSSKRFKKDIKPMDKASEALFALEPVTFHYQNEIDPVQTSQFGLVAEDVEQVNPDLVVRDKEGKTYSVRYDQVNAMLLNEFLKEHRTVQAQQQEIDALQQELKNQRALIERVTARIGLDTAGARLVADKL